jgi:Peptidase inhibitor family I36
MKLMQLKFQSHLKKVPTLTKLTLNNERRRDMAIIRIFALFTMVFFSGFNYLDTCHAQPRRSTRSTVACKFYKHTNARGNPLSVGPGRSSYIGGGLNDEVSTVWVKRGYKVTIFKHDNYKGSSRVILSSDRRGWRGNGGTYINLGALNFNDRLTSYIVERERTRRFSSHRRFSSPRPWIQRPCPYRLVPVWTSNGVHYVRRRY